MLNLKEIEKAIDELLNSETEETLNAWLEAQPQIQPYLGEGQFLLPCFNSQHIEIVSPTKVSYVTDGNDNEFVDNLYTMAA